MGRRQEPRRPRIRRVWKIKPVPRVVESKKRYSRRRSKRALEKDLEKEQQ